MMKMRCFLLFLIILQFSCSNDLSERQKIGELESILMKNEFKLANLPIASAQLSKQDTVSFKNFTDKLQDVSKILVKEFDFTEENLVINCYVKSSMIGSSYTSYKYALGLVTESSEVPLHVKDVFEDTFVCYSPEYWKKYPLEKSFLLKFDTLGDRIVLEVIEVR